MNQLKRTLGAKINGKIEKNGFVHDIMWETLLFL